jgi:hypothetical protein
MRASGGRDRVAWRVQPAPGQEDTHMQIRNIGLLVGLTVAGLVGCERREAPIERTDPVEPEIETPRTRPAEPAAEPAGAMKGKHSAAIDAIAKAKCSREQRCGNVGAGKRYTSNTDCVADVREDWREDLNAYECRGGIVQKELSECVSEIENEDCANPFDTLGRVVACRASDICEDM